MDQMKRERHNGTFDEKRRGGGGGGGEGSGEEERRGVRAIEQMIQHFLPVAAGESQLSNPFAFSSSGFGPPILPCIVFSFYPFFTNN